MEWGLDLARPRDGGRTPPPGRASSADNVRPGSPDLPFSHPPPKNGRGIRRLEEGGRLGEGYVRPAVYLRTRILPRALRPVRRTTLSPSQVRRYLQVHNWV